MFKSKKGICMKSNEELQTYIICLRKQLAVSLNENRILKIKMHRLESELQKKDMLMQNIVASSKEFDIKKLVKQHGKGLILNMQRQIHVLEEKLLQNEMAPATKPKSHKNSETKILKHQESKLSLKNRHLYPSQQSINQMKDVTTNENDLDKKIDDEEDWKIDDSCLNIMKMLKEQTNTEKYDTISKNNQISYLLNKLKSFRKVTNDTNKSLRRSGSVISTDRSSTCSSSTLQAENEKCQPCDLSNGHDFDKIDLNYEKIEPTEEAIKSAHPRKNKKNSSQDLKSHNLIKSFKPKTKIEYSLDSEVSSDEEYSWQSNTGCMGDGPEKQFIRISKKQF